MCRHSTQHISRRDKQPNACHRRPLPLWSEAGGCHTGPVGVTHALSLILVRWGQQVPGESVALLEDPLRPCGEWQSCPAAGHGSASPNPAGQSVAPALPTPPPPLWSGPSVGPYSTFVDARANIHHKTGTLHGLMLIAQGIHLQFSLVTTRSSTDCPGQASVALSAKVQQLSNCCP